MNNWNKHQKEIKDLEEALSNQDKKINSLQDKVSKKQKKVETLENIRKVLEEYSCDKEKLYFNIQKKHRSINEEVIQLEKEYNASNKKYKFLETKMNDLNSKIVVTEEKLEKLTSQLNKMIIDHDKSQKEYNSSLKDIRTQIYSQSKNLNELCKEIQDTRYHQKNLQKKINSYKKDILTKKKTKTTFEKEADNIKALEQATQEIREKERELADIQKKKKIAEQNMSNKQEWTKKLKKSNELLKEILGPEIRNVELRGIYENMSSTVEQRITLIENDLKDLQQGIDNYNQILKEKDLIMQAHIKDNTDIHNTCNFNRFKENDLAHFEELLGGIKRFGRNNNIDLLNGKNRELQDINRKLQHIKNKFEELEEANWIDKQDIVQYRFENELYSKERRAIILDYGLNARSFVAPIHADSSQNLESLQEKRSKILKAISERDQELHIIRQKSFELTKNSNKLHEMIIKLQNDLNDDKLELQYNPNNDRLNQLLVNYNERKFEYAKESYELSGQLLQNKDERGRKTLEYITVSTKICDYRSREIDTYQSELESLQTKKSNLKTDLKTRIDDELGQIRSQFEIDLQNLQKSSNEKTSQLESVQSKLAALEKRAQQETKQQELQGQLDKLATQIDTTCSEKEGIVQELETYHKEVEKLHKSLIDVERERMLLGTKLEESKTKLEETEKRLKLAEAEQKEKRTSAEKARSLLENCIIKKGQQEKDLAKAEEEKKVLEARYSDSKQLLTYLEQFMQRLNTHLYGKDSFTEGLSPNEWLVQAQEEVKKARELLNARMKCVRSDAVISMNNDAL